MTPIIYNPSPLQAASQNTQEALNFTIAVDEFLAFLNANPTVRQNIKIALSVFFGAAIIAELLKTNSK